MHIEETGNPKDLAGRRKPQMHLIPKAACEAEANVMSYGASKYGAWNWRDDPVRATVYVGAIMRHLTAWMDGEDDDSDSGLSHVAHIRANTAVLLDAAANDALIDDRPRRTPHRQSSPATIKPTCYIAGPMRGKPNWNQKAFADAAKIAKSRGWNVINPVALDKDAGVNLDGMDPLRRVANDVIRAAVARDIDAISSLRPERGDVLVVLDGWELSIGAYAERALADWLGLTVHYIGKLPNKNKESK